jgi:peptide/nickel transport system permease protein
MSVREPSALAAPAPGAASSGVSPFIVVLGTIIAVVVLAAIFADFIALHPADEASLRNRLKPPVWLEGGSWIYPLGTDDLGRDIWSRMIFGARVSLSVGLFAVGGAGSIGVALGLIAGYMGGRTDAVIMRFTDAALAVPLILVALLFVVTLGQAFINVIIALAILLWSRYTRVIRSEVLSLKGRDFVALARIAGASHLRIMVRHILPNIMNTTVVLFTLQLGTVILVEASLSFLGAGVPPPTPAWGTMVADGRDFTATAWWISFFPGVAILVTVLSFNLLGDWLRDRLDPKLRQL